MYKAIGDIAAKMKEIIDTNGPDYITKEPYQVYLELVKDGAADGKTAGAILHALASKAVDDIGNGVDFEAFSKTLQSECCLNKKMSDRVSEIFGELYSAANKASWKKKESEGLRQFLKKKFEYDWDGFAIWDAGNGTIDCMYHAEITLSPTDAVKDDENLLQMLKENPFTTCEEIERYFAGKLEEYMDGKFDYYCKCDDYYQPTVEDFEAWDYAAEWGKKNGFEFVSCDGSGSDGGYEPRFRRW